MANKINKQLKKGSPLFDLGQGIASLLDFEAIGRASNPNRDTGSDLFGRSLIHLGAVMSQLDEDEKPAVKEEEKKQLTEEEVKEKFRKLPQVILETPDPKLQYRAKLPTLTPEKERPINNDPPVDPKQPALTGDLPIDIVTPTETTSGSGLGTYDYNEQSYTGTGSDGGQLGSTSRTRRKVEAGKVNNTQGEIANQRAEEFSVLDYARRGYNKVMSMFQRQKDGFDDDNPIKRLALEQPETFEKFKGLMYKRKHAGESPLRKIAHIYNSPFTRTDQTPDMEGVDYRYMQRATMPEYAKQGFGSAAAEGFNLAIDRQNYKRAAQESYDRELEDEMGELVIDYDPSAGENFNKDRLEALSGWKSEYANMKAQYARGEITNAELKAGLQSFKDQAAQFKAAQDTLGQLRQQFMEGKGTHDIAASKPEMVDFYNTLEHNPDSFTVKNIDGVQHLVGTTEGGKEVKVPVSKVANGQAGFKLVQKVNPLTYVDAGNKVASTYIEEYATKYGIGKGNVSAEQIRPRMEQYFYTVIGDDVNKLRSLAAAQGLDYDGFEQLVNATGDAKKENMQLIKNDIVQDLMQDFEATYFPKSVTTKYDPNKTGIMPANATKEGAVDKRARTDTQKYLSEYNNLGEITEENVGDLAAIGNITKARFKDGKLQVAVGKKQYTLSDNPEVRRRQIITIAGGNAKYIQ